MYPGIELVSADTEAKPLVLYRKQNKLDQCTNYVYAPGGTLQRRITGMTAQPSADHVHKKYNTLITDGQLETRRLSAPSRYTSNGVRR